MTLMILLLEASFGCKGRNCSQLLLPGKRKVTQTNYLSREIMSNTSSPAAPVEAFHVYGADNGVYLSIKLYEFSHGFLYVYALSPACYVHATCTNTYTWVCVCAHM